METADGVVVFEFFVTCKCLTAGHDAIVTLLKHYKRPQDDSPCNEYSQPGGGEVLCQQGHVGPLSHVLMLGLTTAIFWNHRSTGEINHEIEVNL